MPAAERQWWPFPTHEGAKKFYDSLTPHSYVALFIVGERSSLRDQVMGNRPCWGVIELGPKNGDESILESNFPGTQKSANPSPTMVNQKAQN